jgi:hypothetical protein
VTEMIRSERHYYSWWRKSPSEKAGQDPPDEAADRQEWDAAQNVKIATALQEVARLQLIVDEFRANAVMKTVSSAQFEHNGVNVVIDWRRTTNGKTAYNYQSGQDLAGKHWVELKPEVGDDFPSIMRQMARLHADTLVTYDYNGHGATEAQMRAMFKASGIQVVFVREIEAEMQRAGHG